MAMDAITNPKELKRHQKIVAGITLNESELNPQWIRKRGWKVVPVEGTGHFSAAKIATLVAALREAGCERCIAIATESVEPDGVPGYSFSTSEEEFQHFNDECGLFRYLLTDEKQDWAISCSEWYNLFAGKSELLQAMLGKSIAEAREEFLSFAKLLAEGSDEPLLRIAKRYSEL
jgi:hypothetical protein